MSTTWDFSGGSLGAATQTRSTVGKCFDGSGVLQTAAINAARFDHWPKTPFAQRGLLNEPAVINYAQYTEVMALWYVPYQVYLGVPAGTAPDGVSNFAFWSDNYAYDSHSVNVPLSVLTIGDMPRVSFFVQNPNWPTEGLIYFDLGNGHTDGTQTVQVGFNVTTGVLGSFRYGNGSGAPGSGIMVDCGGGTFWVSLNFGDAIVDNTGGQSIRVSSHFGPGDAVSGFYLWGLNLKNTGTEFDSYVANSGSGTTSRAADVTTLVLGSGATQVVVTADDASTQTITGLSAGSYVLTTALNRPWVESVVDNGSGGGTDYPVSWSPGNVSGALTFTPANAGTGSATVTAAAGATGAASAAETGSATMGATAAETGAAAVGTTGVGSLPSTAAEASAGNVATVGAGGLFISAAVVGAGIAAETGSATMGATAAETGAAAVGTTGVGSLPSTAAEASAGNVAESAAASLGAGAGVGWAVGGQASASALLASAALGGAAVADDTAAGVFPVTAGLLGAAVAAESAAASLGAGATVSGSPARATVAAGAMGATGGFTGALLLGATAAASLGAGASLAVTVTGRLAAQMAWAVSAIFSGVAEGAGGVIRRVKIFTSDRAKATIRTEDEG